MPVEVPLRRSRAQQFDDYVLDAVERLERRWSEEIAQLDFAVEEVPPVPGPQDGDWFEEPIPLARLITGTRLRRTRIVLYRRPIEARCAPEELAAVVHNICVEEVAEVLGLAPEDVDPHYDEG